MSKSKSKTTSNQTTNQTATTTPNAPSWIAQPWQQYTGQVSDLMNSGQPLIAGASPLQQQAFNNAANLSGGGWFDQAAQMAQQAGNAGPNYSGQAAQAGVTGYNGQGYQAAGQVGGNTYQASNAQGQGYQAQTYDPATGQAVNSQAANAGQAQGYNPNTIDWSQFDVDRATVGPMAQASNRDMSRDDIDRLMNTGLNDLIDASRADYEASAGRSRAQQATAAAMNGGARNSNNAIQAALMEGELSRAQNTGLSGLRYDAYNTAAGLAQADLARAAQTSQFNAGQTNQGTLAQAQIDASRNSLAAQLGQTGLLANQNALNQAGQFNAGAANDFALQNAGFQQQTNLANQQAQNQFGLANMDAQNTASQFNAGSQNAAAQFGANAQNTANLANQQAQNAASQFNAGSLNQSQLDAAGRQDAASQFGASAQNTANQFTAGQMNNASQFNAAAQNQNNQFNAGQADSAANRQLSAAGLLGQLSTGQGANERDNIALQAALGGTQRDIANAQQQGDYARLAMLQQLLGGVPMGAFVGQTTTGNMQSNGTQTTTQNPGMMGILGGLGGMAMGLGSLGWAPFGGSK